MVMVAYICDRKKCGERCSNECLHTLDYSHAKNKDIIPDISKVFDVQLDAKQDVFITEKEER